MMDALEELEAANLTRAQQNYFIGALARMFDDGDVTRAQWDRAIYLAKEFQS